MKKGILILLAVLSLTAKSQTNLKLQERGYWPQYEGVSEFYREDIGEDKLIIGYVSKYGDTVYVYWLKNYELDVTDKYIQFNCKFTNFNISYTKKKGQIKRYYENGYKKGNTMFVGTYKNHKEEVLMLRQDEGIWYGGFNNSASEVIIKKGNNIHVFNLL